MTIRNKRVLYAVVAFLVGFFLAKEVPMGLLDCIIVFFSMFLSALFISGISIVVPDIPFKKISWKEDYSSKNTPHLILHFWGVELICFGGGDMVNNLIFSPIVDLSALFFLSMGVGISLGLHTIQFAFRKYVI